MPPSTCSRVISGSRTRRADVLRGALYPRPEVRGFTAPRVIFKLSRSPDSHKRTGLHPLKDDKLLAGGALLREQLFFSREPPAIPRECPVFAYDAMARHHDGHGVRGASSRHGPDGLGLAQ